MRVLLIAGGWSSEREVSLAGARNIEAALAELGHEVECLDLHPDMNRLLERAKACDFAFINLHGSPGEDGLVQAVLETAGCPYQGSGPAGSFLALNKNAAKAVFAAAGIPTPRWQLVTEPGQKVTLPVPLFVKPNTGGSSLGMSLVRHGAELPEALAKVFAMGAEPLVEELTPGRELTCGILGETPLPLVMIVPKPGSAFFDYENKYDADGAQEICPAPVDEALTRTIQELTLKAHRALGLRGYSRGDFVVGEDGSVRLLEMNTLPGMTATSLLPREAAAVGMTFADLIAELIRLGLEG
jgi:D-alanine-D-alanine ligase